MRLLIVGRRARIHRQVALPSEHGAWALFLGPLLIGFAAGQHMTIASAYLIVASSCGFLMRAPLTVWVKVRAGRKPKNFGGPAALWTTVFALIGALHIVGLVLRGFGFLLWLAIPGVPILGWHLSLIARRLERRQLGVEVVGVAFLALSAPAAMWCGRGFADPRGWVLYGLVLLAGIWQVLYSYLRLGQKQGTAAGPTVARGVVWGVSLAALGASILAAALGWAPLLAPLAFALLPLETGRGLWRPATRLRPRQIGIQLLLVATAYTLTFCAVWCITPVR